MYNVDWLFLISNNVFFVLLTPIRIAWLQLVISPVRSVHASFLQYRDGVLYTLNFNSQTIYMEHVLNDRFDTVTRGIYIENQTNTPPTYFYNAEELRDPVYMYNAYDATVTYDDGEFAVYNNMVWKAVGTTVGILPSVGSSHWTFYKDITFYRNLAEYAGIVDFIVMVPVAVTFDINEMKALVNFYKEAGKRYTIQTF